jgi:hypothetical protein
LPKICFTNKLERIIASRLYLRYQTIDVSGGSDPSALEASLSKFGKVNERLEELKHICCATSEEHCNNLRRAIELIKLYTALKTVVFYIILEDLFYRSSYFTINKSPITSAEIVAHMHLHGLANYSYLTKICLNVSEGRRADLKQLKGIIKDFSLAFLELHGSAAAKRLELGITDENGLTWLLESQA